MFDRGKHRRLTEGRLFAENPSADKITGAPNHGGLFLTLEILSGEVGEI